MDNETSQEELDQMVMDIFEQHDQFMAQLDDEGEVRPQPGGLWDYGDPQQFDPQPATAPTTSLPTRCSYDRPRRTGRSCHPNRPA